MDLLFTLSCLLCLTIASSIPTSTRADTDKEAYRLPEIYNPTNYELSLTVPEDVFTNESSTTYTGTVKIQFEFTKNANFISLHAQSGYIDITNVNFNGSDVDAALYSIDNTTNILSIDITEIQENIILNNSYALIITYNGRLSTQDMYGFYKSSYVDKDNVTHYLATTQFEPTHARKAYPCFDEPSFKATFDVSITYPTGLGLNVLFNTNPLSSTDNNETGLTTTIFEQTPSLSTYLLAFIVSEFTCTPGDSIDGVTFQVCSRDEAKDTRNLSVEIGSKVIDRLNIFTNLNYNQSMKKMDQVAIPDFSAGAMENWGLVTYREAALLWDKDESSNRYNQRITTVIAHEFAHQWFGDLVTCKWWSEIFLNEGFATYFEYHIANEVVSNWELDKQFLIEQVHPVLVVDALKNSQALQSDAYTPTEISAKFGTVSYNKGGSILRMVAHVLGLDNFKAGLQKYLEDNAYQSVEPEQLWTALDGISNVTLPVNTSLVDVMENWITKSGFPVINVAANDMSVVIKQERFLLSGTDDDATSWYVPISYTLSGDTDKFQSTSPQIWLTPSDETLTIDVPNNTLWIVLNNQQTGYYRVNYDDTLWESIKIALQEEDFGEIGDLNRAQIVDDLFNLARATKVEYPLVFSTTGFLANDTSYYPWYAAFNGYDFLLRRVGQNKLGQAISSSVLGLMDKLYQSVPFSNVNADDQIYTHNQVQALTWACKLGNENCTKEVELLYQEYKNSSIRPNKNLRTVVYCNALRYSSDASDWEFLWDAYLNATDLATEQVTILSALGCTKDTTLLKEYLQKTITDGSGIRSQDALSAYSSVYSGNPEGIAVAYEFLVENYETIAEKYQSMNSLGSLIKGIAERFTTEQEVNNLKTFIESEDLPEEFLSAAQEALESSEANIAWIETFEHDLNEYYGLSGVSRIGASFGITLLIVLFTKLIIY